MRSVNVTYKIYEFSELSEDAKAKVKKWYLDNFYQNEEFSDICKEDLSHRFPKSDLNVQYSLSYCQGAGLNVYGTLILIFCILSSPNAPRNPIMKLNFQSSRYCQVKNL